MSLEGPNDNLSFGFIIERQSVFFYFGLKSRSSANFPLDPGAGRDCEEGEDHVGAAPTAADAGPAQPQQGEAR